MAESDDDEGESKAVTPRMIGTPEDRLTKTKADEKAEAIAIKKRNDALAAVDMAHAKRREDNDTKNNAALEAKLQDEKYLKSLEAPNSEVWAFLTSASIEDSNGWRYEV
jgi:predicted class III extradiol MEMO1 family dioxygenase